MDRIAMIAGISANVDKLAAERDKFREQNKALLEALEPCRDLLENLPLPTNDQDLRDAVAEAWGRADAAIAAAREG